MNDFESEIIKAIGRHYPSILSVIDSLVVVKRRNTSAGSYTDFEPLEAPIVSHTQILDLHGTIDLSSNVQLSAHIQMHSGIPKFLEICCLSSDGWDGSYAHYEIHN